jgi:hypothetical protein
VNESSELLDVMCATRRSQLGADLEAQLDGGQRRECVALTAALIVVVTAVEDEGNVKIEHLGESRSSLGGARVFSNNDALSPVALAMEDVLLEQGPDHHVVAGCVKEPEHLCWVEVNRDDVVRPRHLHHVCHQPSRHSPPLLDLVLLGVRKVRHHQDNTLRRRDPRRVAQDEQLHHCVVRLRASERVPSAFDSSELT